MTVTNFPVPVTGGGAPPKGQGSISTMPKKASAVITIGSATIADAPAMAALGAKTFTETFGYSVPKEDLDTYLAETYVPEVIVKDLADPNKASFVARNAAGEVVAKIQLVRGETHSSLQCPAAEAAVLQKLYVDASVHGQGIGTKLVALIEEQARQEGFKKLWLTVWEDNVIAQKMYEKLGYVRTGEIDFATGTCIQTDWVLTKSL
ncbi:acyl-CoA N-acyltransferase [Xylariales sp. PMI_506]|nr:acyl-CoA N-acyltransferase [Xylariales sp. PMI_506]